MDISHPLQYNFWGDRSLSIRNSTTGKGRKPKVEDISKDSKPWYDEVIPIDEASLKNFKPKIKHVFATKPKKTLDDLVKVFQQRRNA